MKTIYLLLFTLIFCFSLSAQNSALRFDGTEEYVSVPHNNDFNIGDQHTMEAWIFAEEWTGLSWQGSIINKDSQGPDVGFAFRCGENGILSFVMSVDNVWNEVLTPPIMNAKQWHHVAVVINNGSMILYIDGQESANGTYSGTPIGNASPINIGASPGFGGRFFNGVIDEVRIWNIARSASEIAGNKTTDLTGSEPGLVAYFPMNEGSGSLVGDLVGNNNATTVNMNDSNWLDGYTLPDYDVSIQGVGGIDRIRMKDRPVRINTTLQNAGTKDIGDIDLSVSVNGSLVATETITEAILVGEQINYTINTPLDLTGISNPEIEVIATQADDANSLNNTANTTIITRSDNLINLFDNEQHNFGSAGQSQVQSVVLPNDLSVYEQLILHIDLSCPSGGCDPWDQAAKVIATTDQGSFEIARYITPYGIACGDWTVDVTDFKSILQGEVSFTSYIQVWGQSGWLATIDLELVEGSAPRYNKIQPLWQDDYQVYGDPSISYDLEGKVVSLDPLSESSHVRMTITGHGQGNTNNAAEFYNVNHSLNINNNTVENHNLWKADCASNSCDNQAGNWLFARAGWCPGQQVTPRIFNTTDILQDGDEIDYVLQDYTNLLNTGYDNSGHTEPFYRIHSFFIENSNEPYSDFNNLTLSTIESILGTDQHVLELEIKNTGQNEVSDFSIRYLVNGTEVGIENYTGSPIPSNGSTNQSFVLPDNVLSVGQNTIIAEVLYVDDEDLPDNLGVVYITLSSTEDLYLHNGINVMPNPTNGFTNITFDEAFLGGTLKVSSLDGRLIESMDINGDIQFGDLLQNGTYILTANHHDGYTATKKLVVIK
jgi:hypothetical protein